MAGTTVDVQALHAALDAERVSRGLSWRKLAAELGLSPSTFSRLANGQKPDVDAFAAMVSWLGGSADMFILTDEKRAEADREPDLLTQLAPLLRARSDLGETEVRHLEELIGSAVRHFRADAAARG